MIGSRSVSPDSRSSSNGSLVSRVWSSDVRYLAKIGNFRPDIAGTGAGLLHRDEVSTEESVSGDIHCDLKTM